MSRLTEEMLCACDGCELYYDCDDGTYFECEKRKFYEKVQYYENLEEQGELVVQKHGQWEPVKISGTITIFRCSICRREVHSGNDYFGEPTKHIVSRYPYCHCGAKMEA